MTRAKSKRIRDRERFEEYLLRRAARSRIMEEVNKTKYYDLEKSETVNQISYHEINAIVVDLFPGINFGDVSPWWLKNDDDCGQVLSDSRGRGCLQITR